MHLMPGTSPNLPGLEVALRFHPARELGGDLYDFLTYGKERHVLAVGDVSGKGAPAALYGAMASGILRSLAPQKLSPPDLLKRLNLILLERKIEGHFITLTYAIWEPRIEDAAPRQCGNAFARAGQKGSMPAHSRRRESLWACSNTPSTRKYSVKLESGDLFAMFSDGIVEAANTKHEEFGPRRLENVLRRNSHRSPQEIIDTLFDEVREFEQGRPPRDDQTIVLIRVK